MSSALDRPGEEPLSHGESAQTMATLLDEETAAYPHLRRGEIIEGVVVGTDRDGVLVDIGAKSEGVIPPHEMHCLRPEGPSRLKPGEKVLVFIVQPESAEGQIVLSLDRARGEQGWRVLQDYYDQGTAFEAHVSGHNKGGLLVNVEGVNAFVPLSQIAGRPERGSVDATEKALADWVGKPLLLKVIELNRRRNRAILSQRAAVQERRAQEKDRLLQELSEGDLRLGRITSIRDFGIFVDIGGADGLVHLSELSWERTPKSPHEMFHVGDEVEVYVMKIDQENKKIGLSVRRAQPEQWEDIVSNYREGQIAVGQVTKLAPFGAFVRLEGPIEGLIHISELVEQRIQHPREVVREDDIVPVKIVRIEHDRHRLGLSLRQARDKMEEEGWVFNDSGGVEVVPEDVRVAVLGEAAAAAEAEPTVEEPEAAVEEPVVEAGGGEPTLVEEAQPQAEASEETAGQVLEAEAAVEEPALVEEAQPEAEASEETAGQVLEAEATLEEPAALVEEAQPQAEASEETAGQVREAEAAVEEPAVVEEAQPEAEASEEAAGQVLEAEAALEEPAAVEEAQPEAEASEEPAQEVEAEGEQVDAAETEEESVTEPPTDALNTVDEGSAAGESDISAEADTAGVEQEAENG